MGNIISDIIHFKRTKQANIIISLYELSMLIYLDYIFLIKMGIKVHDKFLSSWENFIYNILTPDFFLAILGIIIMYFIYSFAFPFLLPLLIFRILYPIYLLIAIITMLIQLLFEWIHSIITKNPMPTHEPPTFEFFLITAKCITKNATGEILRGTRFQMLKDLYYDLKKDDGVYEFFVRCSALFSATIYILISFQMNVYLIILFSILLFIALFLAFVFHTMIIRISYLDEIIIQARTS